MNNFAFAFQPKHRIITGFRSLRSTGNIIRLLVSASSWGRAEVVSHVG